MTQKILFVGSSANHATTFECYFRDAGFEAICVASCTEASKLLEKYNFDLIFTDFDCPQVDGNGMIEEVAAMSHPVPMIVHASDAREVIHSPIIKEVVLKPASIFQISDVIDKSLSMVVC